MNFQYKNKKIFVAVFVGVVFIVGFVMRFAYAEYYSSCGSTGSFFSLGWQRFSNCDGIYPYPNQPDFVSNSNDVNVTNEGVTLSSQIELGSDDLLTIQAQGFTIAAGNYGLINIYGGTLTISNGGHLTNEDDGNPTASGLQYNYGTFQITSGSVTNNDPSHLSFTSGGLPFIPSQQTSHQNINFNVLALSGGPWQFSGEYPSELTIDSMTGAISAISDIVGDQSGVLYVSGTVSGGYATQAVSYTLDDVVSPSITSVSAANGTYGIGDTVTISLNFSEPVTPSSEINLSLSNGEIATYSSGSGSSEWFFAYTIEEGDLESADLNVTDSTLSTDIQDTGDNNVPGPSMPVSPNTLAEQADVVIDANRPQISSITSDAPDGTYTTGQTINVQVTFSEPINTTGGATLTFNSGGTSATASSIDGDTVTFSYTVGSGEAASDLDVTALNNYSEIEDVAGNSMSAETLPVNPSYTLSGTKDIVIEEGNNTPPVEVPLVQSLTPVTADGTYGAGEQILFDVLFSENVYVTGTPVIDLNSGGTATFSSVSGDTMRFSYTVVEGDSSNDLDAGGTNAFSLGGGSILDADDNEATLTLPVPGGSGSLSANANIVIDTTVVAGAASGSGGGRSNALSVSRPSDENLSLTITALTGTSINVAGAHVPDVIMTDEFGYAYKKSGESNWNIFTERTNVKTESRFSRMIDTLACNTTYVFRAFAKNRIGMTHSDFVTVTTPACGASIEQIAEVESTVEDVVETSNINQLPTVTRVLICPIFETLLAPGDTDPEVSRLKVFLNFLFPDLRLNIQSLQYDDEAQVGVKRFQKMYESTILAPLNLIEATGWWHQSSIDQANTLLGCE